MFDVLNTAFDITHQKNPLNKDVIGHSSIKGKLEGSFVMLLGGVTTLGLLPLFYFITAYQKTRYWKNIPNRMVKLEAILSSPLTQQSKKAAACFEKEVIHKHQLQELRKLLGSKSFLEIKQEIEKNKFDICTIDQEGNTLLSYVVLYEKMDREKRFASSFYKSHMTEVLKLLEYLIEQHKKLHAESLDQLEKKLAHLREQSISNTSHAEQELDRQIVYLVNHPVQFLDKPFSLAVSKGLEEMFFKLIKEPGLDVNKKNPEFITPLQVLVKRSPGKVWEMVQALIQHDKFHALENLDLPQKCPALLVAACHSGKTKLVLELLKLPGGERLLNQPTHAKLPVVAILLDFFEAQKDYEGLSFLIEAQNIDYGSQATNNGSLLHYAIEKGEFGCVRALLKDDRVDVNALNSEGKTPLEGIREGSEIDQLLKNRGAVKSADLKH